MNLRFFIEYRNTQNDSIKSCGFNSTHIVLIFANKSMNSYPNKLYSIIDSERNDLKMC